MRDAVATAMVATGADEGLALQRTHTDVCMDHRILPKDVGDIPAAPLDLGPASRAGYAGVAAWHEDAAEAT